MTGNEHDRGVAAAKIWLKGKGFDLKSPPKIENSEPDVYGVKEFNAGKRVYKSPIEVETSESISGDHAKKQMKDFSGWASKFTSRQAVLFIPTGNMKEAKEELPDYDAYYEF